LRSEQEVNTDASENQIHRLTNNGEDYAAEAHRVEHGYYTHDKDQGIENDGRSQPREDIVGSEEGQDQVDPPGDRSGLDIVVLADSLL